MLKLFHKNPDNLYDKSVRKSKTGFKSSEMGSVLNIRNLLSKVMFKA